MLSWVEAQPRRQRCQNSDLSEAKDHAASLFGGATNLYCSLFELHMGKATRGCIGHYQGWIAEWAGLVSAKVEFQCYDSLQGKMQFMPSRRSKRVLNPWLAMNFQRDLSKFITTRLTERKAARGARHGSLVPGARCCEIKLSCRAVLAVRTFIPGGRIIPGQEARRGTDICGKIYNADWGLNQQFSLITLLSYELQSKNEVRSCEGISLNIKPCVNMDLADYGLLPFLRRTLQLRCDV